MRRLFLALAACQGTPQAAPPQPVIQARDAGGAVVAELRPIRPCRGTIGPVELIVGGPPLIAQLGATRWSGATAANGTTLERDGQPIARIYPVGDANAAAVLDLHGVALARISVSGTTATVSNAATVPVRRLSQRGLVIAADQPALTITGTDDLVLAALLVSPEVVPELRILAACERVLVKAP